MDRQIRKIDALVKKYIGFSKQDIEKEWGKPFKLSDNEMWFYDRYHYGIFKDNIAFFFEDDRVIDIAITEYMLWIEINNIFYFKGEEPCYKSISLL